MSLLFDYMCMGLPFILLNYFLGSNKSNINQTMGAFEPFLITAFRSVCVPAVIGALAVWLASAPITAGSLVSVNLNPINDTYIMPKSNPEAQPTNHPPTPLFATCNLRAFTQFFFCFWAPNFEFSGIFLSTVGKPNCLIGQPIIFCSTHKQAVATARMSSETAPVCTRI